MTESNLIPTVSERLEVFIQENLDKNFVDVYERLKFQENQIIREINHTISSSVLAPGYIKPNTFTFDPNKPKFDFVKVNELNLPITSVILEMKKGKLINAKLSSLYPFQCENIESLHCAINNVKQLLEALLNPIIIEEIEKVYNIYSLFSKNEVNKEYRFIKGEELKLQQAANWCEKIIEDNFHSIDDVKEWMDSMNKTQIIEVANNMGIKDLVANQQLSLNNMRHITLNYFCKK